ncbi:predicted protein, partial [Nematostella vectensis]
MAYRLPVSIPSSQSPVEVYCELDTNDGSWTAIQMRIDGTVDFYRDWGEYQPGFGDKAGEYWLGFNNIHAITSQRRCRVLFEMQDFEGN